MYEEFTKENALENAFILSTTNDRSKKTKDFLGHLFYLFIILCFGFDPRKWGSLVISRGWQVPETIEVFEAEKP